MKSQSDDTAGIRPGAITAQFNDRIPRYLDGLNAEQEDAVKTIQGPLLVLAGAGTGKTRVLTTRIAHILANRNARANEILAVTFTNKAAREMKNRIGRFVGGTIEAMPWLGTFHAVGAKILRHHAELVELKPDFTILDTDDQIRLFKQLLQAHQVDEKRWPARQLAYIVDGWKNKGLQPKNLTSSDVGNFADGKGAELYASYQERLKILNAADFGDLTLECIRLLRDNPDVLSRYQRCFRYVLIDEYQDTNIAQYLWLRLLAQGNSNICAVGDDDQSIYGWRGAEVENILRFEKDFAGARVIRLERNYRSTSKILRAASHLISHNQNRLGKTLRTDPANEGEPVAVISAWDSAEEARCISEDIEQFQRQGHALASMAILVRASFQMREFEERFIQLGLNYRVIGGPRFYERREIRDALAYFRIALQPSDDLAFERIANLPKRGLGNKTMQTLHKAARAANVPIVQATRDLIETDELGTNQRSTLRRLLSLFEDWSVRFRDQPHAQVAEAILDESGYTEMWQKDRSADAPGRLENLKELIRSMEEFDTMGGFLEHVSLVMERDSADGSDDAVSIMTLHAAKGLEFDTVFLPGWEEGLFPHQRALDESGQTGLEEERRLAYVGITRAKRHALLSFVQNRRIHGLWQSALPSRFLDELPADAVEVRNAGSAFGGNSHGGRDMISRFDTGDPFDGTYNTPGWQRAQKQRGKRAGDRGPVIEGKLVLHSDNRSNASRFSVGDTVTHLKFGAGTVIAVEGNKLTIDFPSFGHKKVLENFIKKP